MATVSIPHKVVKAAVVQTRRRKPVTVSPRNGNGSRGTRAFTVVRSGHEAGADDPPESTRGVTEGRSEGA